MSEEPETAAPEGWGAMRPGDRRYHYYADRTSLCRKIGFYFGPLTDHNPEQKEKGKEDCPKCWAALQKRLEASRGA